MEQNSDWSLIRNILCIRLDNLGDIIMLSPSFRALKESFPHAKITLLTSSVGTAIAPFVPNIDEVLTYNAPWIENTAISSRTDNFFEKINELKSKNFDGAIIFTNYSQSPFPPALIAYLAGVPKVLSYSRELPDKLITDWIPDSEPFTKPIHGVKRSLNLVHHIGATTTSERLELAVRSTAKESLQKKLQTLKIKKNSLTIILHTTASLGRRQYEKSEYVKAAKKLISDFNATVLLTGTRGEKEEVDEVQKLIGKGSYSLAGELLLEEFIALIQSSDLLISNNTGPVHIAAAVGTPVVVMYARTNPEHTPWNVKSKVLYYDVSENERSKNQIIQFTTPKKNSTYPIAEDIISAVIELLNLPGQRKEISQEILRWE